MALTLSAGAPGAMLFVTPKVPPSRNGVGDYAYTIGRELAASGRVLIVTSDDQRGEDDGASFTVVPVVPRWDFGALRILRTLVASLVKPVINLQWVPFLWGRWGINPAVPFTAAALRRSGCRVITTVHEPYVDLDTWGRCVYGPVQRLELAVLAMGSEVLATTPVFASRVRHLVPWRRGHVGWAPICSSIPAREVTPDERASVRRRVGVADDGLLAASFSPLGSGKQVATLIRAWSAIAADVPGARLLMIGETADAVMRACPEARRQSGIVCTGFCEVDEVSRLLAASDLVLAPLTGGISTRNSSVIAAMEHGLPIVTTRGPMTDAGTFASAPMTMVDHRDGDGFVAAARGLAGDRKERARLGEAVRAFHDRHFDRRLVAAQVREAAARAMTA